MDSSVACRSLQERRSFPPYTPLPCWCEAPVLIFYNPGFTSGTGVPGLIGKTLPYDGELSADQVAGIHADYKSIYPGLP